MLSCITVSDLVTCYLSLANAVGGISFNISYFLMGRIPSLLLTKVYILSWVLINLLQKRSSFVLLTHWFLSWLVELLLICIGWCSRIPGNRAKAQYFCLQVPLIC